MGEEKVTKSTAEISLSGFVIEAEDAEKMARESGAATVEDLLPSLVPAAMRLVRAPISRFPVGAVGLGLSGRIYVGVNLEFEGLPLNHSVHAEQFLISNAAAAGEAGMRCIAVSSVPCGHCRQFLQEVRGAPEIRILVTADGPNAAFRTISSLLPRPFGPPDLLHKGVPLLLEIHDNDLGAIPEANGGDAKCNGGEAVGMDRRLRTAAEAAARAAHAPYSACAAGFAVGDRKGRVYAGSYAESAAYNPSLSPVQAAMVAMVAAGGEEEVVAAALVEKDKAIVSHESTARIFLAAVAPGAHLSVYRYRPSDVV
ncbi:cytidine deaminase 1-like [Typha angustifolia]|uniref:cytidine deaminase 1-like n=1 Tax=Typha angustifolia TaxID=59011 RepID=UPI003C2E21CF